VVSEVSPQVDCGRWPAKACVGDRVAVAATIVRDGHDPLRAVVRHRRGRARWHEEPLRFLGNDVEVLPKKGYLSLRRRKQFAMIKPAAKHP